MGSTFFTSSSYAAVASFRFCSWSGVAKSSTGAVCPLPPPPFTGVWLKYANSE